MLARSRGVPMVVGLGRRRSGYRRHACSTPSMAASCSRRQQADIAGIPQVVDRLWRSAATMRRRICDEAGSDPKGGTRCACRSTSPTLPMSTRIDIATCDGVGLMRTEFLFGKVAARRGDAISRLSQGAGMGWRQAGDDPHRRCRRRQAGAGLHRRGRQPVPWPARHPAVAGATGDLSRADPGVAARRRARQSEGDVPDDRRAGRICACRRAVRARARPRSSRRAASRSDAAARHHGRGAVGGDRA